MPVFVSAEALNTSHNDISTMKRLLIIVVASITLTSCMSVEAQRALDQAEKSDAPLFFEGADISGPDTAGGRKISWAWHNLTGKTIKYMHLDFMYYNAVGDTDLCEYGAGLSVKETGPIESGERRTRQFQNKCYGNNATCVEITGAEVVYMDGSSWFYNNEKVDRFHFRPGSNDCSVSDAQ